MHRKKFYNPGAISNIICCYFLAARSYVKRGDNFTHPLKEPSTSRTYAIPPDIPAAKFRPVRPNITVQPPVIYSQP